MPKGKILRMKKKSSVPHARHIWLKEAGSYSRDVPLNKAPRYFLILPFNFYLYAMSLQNRVNPYGEIITSTSRGTWMGNRGVLSKNRKIVKPYKLLNWITCVLEYRGIRRAVMTDGRYTELFFLDEATSFSAGHRPCAECRRADYTRFKKLWLEANKDEYELAAQTMKIIDSINHAERMDEKGNKKGYTDRLSHLPDGVFVQLATGPDAYLYINGQLLRWTEFGYDSVITVPAGTMVTVLTPKSYVRTFKQGYLPHIHDSAKKLLESNCR